MSRKDIAWLLDEGDSTGDYRLYIPLQVDLRAEIRALIFDMIAHASSKPSETVDTCGTHD